MRSIRQWLTPATGVPVARKGGWPAGAAAAHGGAAAEISRGLAGAGVARCGWIPVLASPGKRRRTASARFTRDRGKRAGGVARHLRKGPESLRPLFSGNGQIRTALAMKRLIPAVVAVSAVVAAGAAAGVTLVVRPPDARAAGAARAARSWGTAIEVPGLGALNKGRFAEVTSVSCASTGNCAAGGLYDGRRFNAGEAFVASRAVRPLGHGDRGTRPGSPEQGRGRGEFLGVVRLGGQLRGCRGLPRPQLSLPGIRGQPAARPLGQGDRDARPGSPEQGRIRLGPVGVVRLGGRLRGRRVLRGPRR